MCFIHVMHTLCKVARLRHEPEHRVSEYYSTLFAPIGFEARVGRASSVRWIRTVNLGI